MRRKITIINLDKKYYRSEIMTDGPWDEDDAQNMENLEASLDSLCNITTGQDSLDEE
jgi:hypothetical protein